MSSVCLSVCVRDGLTVVAGGSGSVGGRVMVFGLDLWDMGAEC